VQIRIRPLNILVLLTGAAFTQNGNPTAAGDFTVEPATLVSLGFEWRITGDDNRNAHVDVRYRKRGEQQWRDGLPLMRLQWEESGRRLRRTRLKVEAPSLHPGVRNRIPTHLKAERCGIHCSAILRPTCSRAALQIWSPTPSSSPSSSTQTSQPIIVADRCPSSIRH
jgi:hypothetical protein